MELLLLICAGILVLVIWFIIQYWWLLLILLVFGLAVGIPLWITSVRKANRIKANPASAGKDDVLYTIIKETPLYEERLEPAWEYSDPDDQWVCAEKVTEYVGNEYDILYVFPDNTYKESYGLRIVPQSARILERKDISYDEAKRGLKKRGFWSK